jgi:hypothetical protein
LFVDPVADIAVLCSPDNQALIREAEAYEELVMGVTPFQVTDAPKQGTKRHKLPYGNQTIDVATPGRGAALVVVGLSAERVAKEVGIRDDMIRVAHRSGASIRQLAEVSGLGRKAVSVVVGTDAHMRDQ